MLSAAFLVALTGTAIGAAVPAAETNHRLVARQDSDNWCGAVKTTNDVKTVEATWTIPTVSVPKGQPSGRDYFAYQWVGTGGTSSCGRNQDLLQCGTSVHVGTDGTLYYNIYYQLFGSTGPVVDEVLGLTGGDKVYAKVTVDSSTSGTVYVKNVKTGKAFTKKLSSTKGRSICTGSADWIHERPGDLPNRDYFPAFTTFSFTGASGTTSSGASFNLKGAEDWKLNNPSSNVQCHPTHTSDTVLKISQGN